jgi:hypothetical protein
MLLDWVHCSSGVRGARLRNDSLPLSLLQGIGDFMHAIDGEKVLCQRSRTCILRLNGCILDAGSQQSAV